MDQGEILVVDNDEAVTRALSLRLEQKGFRCDTANCGMQALAHIKHYPVDLIITDLNMPYGSGTELIKTIRRTSDVPIVVVTGFSDQLENGVQGMGIILLRKPFAIRSLVSLVQAELTSRNSEAA